MNCKHNEFSVTLPVHTTWRSALQAVEGALGDVDEDFLLMPQELATVEQCGKKPPKICHRTRGKTMYIIQDYCTLRGCKKYIDKKHEK
jgi:hypothetical protein